MKDKKQFVVNEDIAKEVSNALEAFIEHIDDDCAHSGCMCDLRGEVCSQHIRNVLHDFDSGLCLFGATTKRKSKEKSRRAIK